MLGMISGGLRRYGLPLGLLLVVLVGSTMAAEPKNYAYFFLQGKISSPEGTKASGEGFTVRLVGADKQTFETVTDVRGVFLFERLPLQRYSLTATTAEGKVIQSFDEVQQGDPARRRLKVRMGSGAAASAELEATGRENLEVTFTARPPKWKRFWREFGIVVGAAVVLAL